MNSERLFDLVLLGATGFTGGLTAEYIAQNGPKDLKWAIAGRNRERLAEVKARLEHETSSHIDIVIADTTDTSSLESLAEKTRVLITTVGPYSEHGWGVVKACVQKSTDYVDITGEPLFVNRVRYELHEEAQKAKIRVVNCCGFDSIPHDLGVLFTVKQLADGGAKSVDGFVSAHGEFSGGTWHSAIGAMANLGGMKKAAKSPRKKDGKVVRSTAKKIHLNKDLNRWAVPLPTIDPKVVCRSAKELDMYGTEFNYGHYLGFRSFIKVAGLLGSMAGIVTAAQIPPLRKLALRFKKQSDGPSETKRAESWFKVRFVGRAQGKKIVTQVSGGDPGYTETAKMLAESGLCLAFDREQLPETYGVLTTAVAMGEPLTERLIKADIKFETIED